MAPAALLPSVAFVLLCVKRLAIELLLRTLKRRKETGARLFRILTCGRIDPEKFLKEFDPAGSFDAEEALELQRQAQKKKAAQLAAEGGPVASDIDEPAEGDMELSRDLLVRLYRGEEAGEEEDADPD